VSPVIQALTATPRFRNVRVANFNLDLKHCANMQLSDGGTHFVCWLEEMRDGKVHWSSVIFRESGGVYINKQVLLYSSMEDAERSVGGQCYAPYIGQAGEGIRQVSTEMRDCFHVLALDS
jgi:hypothetical protein